MSKNINYIKYMWINVLSPFHSPSINSEYSNYLLSIYYVPCMYSRYWENKQHFLKKWNIYDSWVTIGATDWNKTAG